MLRHVAKRMLIFVPSLLLVSMITFVMVRVAGGDPATLRLGFNATPTSLERLRREFGLLDPWPVQYWHWFRNAVRGDLGRSYTTGASVSEEILGRLPATVELTLASIGGAIPLGIAFGTIAAVRPRSFLDNLSTAGGMVGISIPTFWLGVLLIVVFAVWLRWVPVAGSNDVRLGIPQVTGFSIIDGYLGMGWYGLWDAAKHLVLPAATLAGWPAAILARHMRSSLLEVLYQDYIRTGRAKGLRDSSLIWRHAYRNALVPVVTVIALETGYLLGGAVITETIFAWPGIGNLLITAIAGRDYMIVQGAVLLFLVIFAALNAAAELAYAALDPRIRY
jgi:peptide/nickel transport system permease protein